MLFLQDMSKLKNLRSIINGWGNLVFPSQSIETIAFSRILKCSECPHIKESKWVEAVVGTVSKSKQNTKKGSVCGLCNCPIEAKSRSLLEKCPDNRWEEGERVTQTDYIKLNEYNFKIKSLQSSICRIIQHIEKGDFNICFIQKSFELCKDTIEYIDELNDDLFETLGFKRKDVKYIYSRSQRLHKRNVAEIYNTTIKNNFLYDTVKFFHSSIGDIILLIEVNFILQPEGKMIEKKQEIRVKERILIEKMEKILGLVQNELRNGIRK